jgi:predicted RNase H-like HicB family nuclease
MSKKSKKPSVKKSRELPLDRPFTPQILKRAKEIAEQYTVILQPDPDLGYLGRGLEFPYAMDDGQTPDECVRKTREAFVAVVATMLEKGEVPPPPATEHRRQEQINIRVTPEEKLLLEEAARSKGFRGISDFIRAASLASAR